MADDKKKAQRDHLNDLLIEYAPLINLHVNKLKESLPPHIDHEDLYAAGMHGLIDAMHKYDPKKGASFKTHASKRIQGKMKDHVSAGGPNAVDKYHYTQAKKFMSQNKPSTPEGAGEVTEIKPEAKPETQPAAQPEVKPDVQPETQPQPKPKKPE